MTSAPLSASMDPSFDILELLDIERIETDLYRSNRVFVERGSKGGLALFGGQVAAQALRAAGLTVGPDRQPHSLHGYFLRPGDSRIPTVFTVYRDRDGRSYSARRVVAIQNGKVILNMSASFQVPNNSPIDQLEQMPPTEAPESLDQTPAYRVVSMDYRVPSQPFDLAIMPTRFWARSAVRLPDDPLLHACVLTYLTDALTGVLPAADRSAGPGPSLDHAVWFHAAPNMNEWTFTDYQPRVAGHGRGWYTGSIFTAAGDLIASMAQETLFR